MSQVGNLHFCNLEALEFNGHGAVKQLEGNYENLMFEIRCGDDTFDSGERTIDDECPLAYPGILEMLDLNGGPDEAIDGFDMVIGNGYGLPPL